MLSQFQSVVSAKQVKLITFRVSSIKHYVTSHANPFVPGGIYKVQFNWQTQCNYSGVLLLNIKVSDSFVFYQVP